MAVFTFSHHSFKGKYKSEMKKKILPVENMGNDSSPSFLPLLFFTAFRKLANSLFGMYINSFNSSCLKGLCQFYDWISEERENNMYGI